MLSAHARSPRALSSFDQEKERAESKLVALGLMTGGVTHDIRNVLSVVDVSLRIIEGEPSGSERQRAAVAGARAAIARGVALTRELLAFAKHDPPCARVGDVNAMINGATHLLRCAADACLTLEIDLAADLPACMFDEAQLKSALLNLVLNAREAMPTGGLARSLCSTPDRRGMACVRVEDDGPGMSHDICVKIFDPFFTTKGTGGVGLGLSQARACLRLIGGDLLVTSEPGRGAAFDILLPVAPDARDAA